jgi:tetratricopeptide (TPR) repeat protein
MILQLAASVALIFLTVIPVHAAILKGVVIEDEGGGSGMDNVSISVDEASANSTVTKDGGKFAFMFPDKQVGEVVHVRVNSEGYVVVNDVQLEVVLPANPDAKLLTVILCPKAERERWAALLYRITSDKAIEEAYQQKLIALADKLRADAEAFPAEKAKLLQERDEARAAAQTASEELAKDQPGRSSELYQQAKRLFLEGKIDEAIKLLDDEKLRESLAQAEKAIEDVVESSLLKAHLLTVRLRFDEAEATYQKAISAAPDSFVASLEYAEFSEGLDHYEKAKAAYNRCLELVKKSGNRLDLAWTLIELARLDSHQKRMEEAEKEYEDALGSMTDLMREHPKPGFLAIAAELFFAWGNLKKDMEKNEEAREDYEKALELYRSFYKIYQSQGEKVPENYESELAATLTMLVLVDRDQNRIEDARKNIEEVLKIYRERAQISPEVFLPKVAETLGELAIIEQQQDRTEEARKHAEESLETFRKLAGTNPEAYLPKVVAVLDFLASFDHDQNWTEETRKEYQEALTFFRERAEKDREHHLPQVARILRMKPKRNVS